MSENDTDKIGTIEEPLEHIVKVLLEKEKKGRRFKIAEFSHLTEEEFRRENHEAERVYISSRLEACYEGKHLMIERIVVEKIDLEEIRKAEEGLQEAYGDEEVPEDEMVDFLERIYDENELKKEVIYIRLASGREVKYIAGEKSEIERKFSFVKTMADTYKNPGRLVKIDGKFEYRLEENLQLEIKE